MTPQCSVGGARSAVRLAGARLTDAGVSAWDDSPGFFRRGRPLRSGVPPDSSASTFSARSRRRVERIPKVTQSVLNPYRRADFASFTISIWFLPVSQLLSVAVTTPILLAISS